MNILILLVISVVFLICWCINYQKKETKKIKEVILKGEIFLGTYNLHKEENKIRNISLFDFDKVLHYINSSNDLKLHTNTINGIIQDFIIELLEPNLIRTFKRIGYPNTSAAIDRIRLTKYYMNCNIQKCNATDIYNAYVNPPFSNNLLGNFMILAREHSILLNEQMMDENYFKHLEQSNLK